MRTIIPDTIAAGTSFSASTTQLAFADGWTLTLFLRGPGAQQVEATRSGATHTFAATPAATAAWEAGDYAYTIRATDGADVVEVESGRVRITPNLAAGNVDTRSHARITLEAIEAVIEKRATLDQERYRINNRELYRTPIGDLLKLRTFYRNEVAREDARARGRSRFRQIKFAAH